MKIPKSVRNAAVSTVVLLAVLVGAGVAYTYYVGQQESTAVEVAEPVAVQSDPVIKPRKSAADAKVSASVQSLTSPIAPGENASVTVRTLPEAACKIAVIYNDSPSTDSGLFAKRSNEYGIVTWTWTVGASVPEGTWPVDVTCVFNERSAFVRGDLEVKKQPL